MMPHHLHILFGKVNDIEPAGRLTCRHCFR